MNTLLALTFPVSFEQPVWLWLLVLVPVVIAVSARTLIALEPLRRVLAIGARCLVVILLAVCLAEPMHVKSSDKLTVLFLMDRSDSVKGLQEMQEEYIRKACEDMPHKDDLVGLIDFATDPFLQQLPMKGGYHIKPGRLPDMENRDRTDVAAAIRLALAMFKDTAKRIVLLSDGNDNMGDVLAEAATAQAQGVAVDVVPLWYEHGNEVYVDRMVAPTNVEDGDMVPLRLLLHSEKATSGRIDIYHNGQLVNMSEDEYARVKLQPGNNPFSVKIPVHGGGPQRFEARFVADDPGHDDVIEENNYATAFSFVSGKSRVLLLSTDVEEDAELANALRSEKIDVELQDVATGKVDLLGLLNYSAIILGNVPANTFTEDQHKALAHYVSSLGGGLIMTGGDESFGAGGWIGSPVADVMPVHFEIKHKRIMLRGALVLIMHSCEIPRGNFWGVEVAKKSVDTISSKDLIGVLAYSFSPGGVNWEVPLQPATNKSAIKKKIARMSIGDMPDFHTTMQMALKELMKTDASQKHMIIISDGDPSRPARRILQDMKDAKITCSTIGIGYGSHVMEDSLKEIARMTGGTFYPCRNPRLLPQIFVKESKVVRRSLISEEPFTPQVEYSRSELLTGVSASEVFPRLGGMVVTSPKAEAQTALVRIAKDGTKDPVLAHWQAGLGKTVAFTSGYWGHWGYDWVNWDKYSKLWSQIVRWAMRQDAPDNFDVFTRISGNQGRVVVDAVDKESGSLNMLDLPAVIIKPNQTVQPLVFSQTGPGHYEAKFDVDQTGQYIANVSVTEQGQHQGSIQTGVSVPFSPEFRELVTNEALLRKVVEITGGRWHEDIDDVAQHDLFSHDLPPTLSKQPVWNWILAWLVLPIFLLDVSIRRLASWLAFSVVVEVVLVAFLLFGVGVAYGAWWGILGVFILGELVGWSIRFRSIGPLIDYVTHTATALGHTGERSSESLGQLKGVRKQVQADRDTAGPGGARKVAGDDKGKEVDKTRRYDVGDEAAKAPVDDITQSLGGAQAGGDTVRDKRRPPAPDDAADQGADEDATSRLLRAKRRARRDFTEEE